MIQSNGSNANRLDLAAAKRCPHCLAVPVLITDTPEAAFKFECPGHHDTSTWAGGETLAAALAAWNDDYDWLKLGVPKDNLAKR